MLTLGWLSIFAVPAAADHRKVSAVILGMFTVISALSAPGR